MSDSFQIKSEYRNGTLYAAISGEIDHHSAKKMRLLIDSSLKEYSPDKLTIDMSGVTFMDSSGLGLIMGRYRITESAKIKFSVTGTPDRAMEMFSMAGLERIIEFE